MRWTRKLPKPVFLNDGRTVATLAQARDILLALPQIRQSNPHWLDAAEQLMEAAHRGGRDVILEAGKQFSLAMKANDLI